MGSLSLDTVKDIQHFGHKPVILCSSFTPITPLVIIINILNSILPEPVAFQMDMGFFNCIAVAENLISAKKGEPWESSPFVASELIGPHKTENEYSNGDEYL